MNKFSLSLAKKLLILSQIALTMSFLSPVAAQAAVLAVDETVGETSTLKTTEPVIDGEPLREDATVQIEPVADKTINAVFTAYTSTPDQTDGDPFTAASGKKVYMGMIANNCLPFGTKLKLTFADKKIQEKYGNYEFQVHDRMNSRYGCNRFDIWLNVPRKEAQQFGVRRVTVEVFYKKKSPVVATKASVVKELAKAQ